MLNFISFILGAAFVSFFIGSIQLGKGLTWKDWDTKEGFISWMLFCLALLSFGIWCVISNG